MTLAPVNFKFVQINTPIQASTLDLKFFKKTYEYLKLLNEEALKFEQSNLIIGPKDTPDIVEQFKKELAENFKLTIQIFGSRGEYHYVEDNAILDKEEILPDFINNVIFENCSKFNNRFKYNPKNYFNISYDFRKTKIFDLITAPSQPTPNTSALQINAISESWASAVQKKVSDSLLDKKNRRDWLHAPSIYDAFLFLLIMPMSFWMLLKMERHNLFAFACGSKALLLAVYLYFFFTFLTIFRMVFNYSRWVFPKFELKTNSQKASLKHRTFFYALALSILFSFVYDLFKYFIFHK